MKIFLLRSILLVIFLSGSFYNMAKTTITGSSFDAPTGITFNKQGDMFVTDWSAGKVIKLDHKGSETIISTKIPSPAGIDIDANNNIYISSYSNGCIYRIDEHGVLNVISDGYYTPTGITFSRQGSLLITNRASGEIVSLNVKTGEKKIIATQLQLPVGVVQLNDNSIVVSQYGGKVTLINESGSRKELGDSFLRPGVGIVEGDRNSIYVIDNGAEIVRKVDINTGTTQQVTDKISGAVALARYKEHLYIGSWGDGHIYQSEIK